MQTFLPYPDFEKSVKCLDWKRLGKQRVEAMQIINALEGRTRGWRHHPAVLMWKGRAGALKLYCNCCIKEWIRRGFNNTMRLYRVSAKSVKPPLWFGNPLFHKSHRAALLAKDFGWYSKFGWKTRPAKRDAKGRLSYYWPVKK